MSLVNAARDGNGTEVRRLIDAGANLEEKGGFHGWTALFWAAMKGHSEIVGVLLEAGANVNAVAKNGITPLHEAAGNGHSEIVGILLEAGANVNAVSEGGGTPLHGAAVNGHSEIVGILVEAGANVNAVAKDGWTPLHGAAREGRSEIVRVLLEAGANVNAVAKDGWTPLHRAAWKVHSEIVGILLEAGANVNAVDKYGDTPLHLAASANKLEAVRVLLEGGADPSIRNNDGKLPIDVTTSEVIKALLQLPPSPRRSSGAAVGGGGRDSIVNELREQLSKAQEERDTLRGERETLRGERNTLRRERDTLRGERDILRGERDTLQNRASTLESENSALRGERDTLRGELESAQARISELEALRSSPPSITSPLLASLLHPPPPHPSRDPASYPRDLALFDITEDSPQQLPGGCNGAVAILKLSADPHSPPVAAKLVYNLGAMSTSRAAINIKSEFETLLRLPRHSNIVRMYWESMCDVPESLFERLPLDEGTRDACTHVNPVTGLRRIPKFATLLLEAYPHTLEHHLTTLPPGYRPWPLLRRWFRDLTSGIAHLYLHRIAHLDLKLDNIMVAEDGRLVLVDFGSAMYFRKGGEEDGTDASLYERGMGVCSALAPAFVSERHTLEALRHPTPPFRIAEGRLTASRSSPFGNPSHVSPEVRNTYTHASSLHDGTIEIDYTHQPVFALGMIFGELLCGESPIENYPVSTSTSSEHPTIGPYDRPTFLPEGHPYPPRIVSMVQDMVSFDPNARPTLADVLETLFSED